MLWLAHATAHTNNSIKSLQTIFYICNDTVTKVGHRPRIKLKVCQMGSCQTSSLLTIKMELAEALNDNPKTLENLLPIISAASATYQKYQKEGRLLGRNSEASNGSSCQSSIANHDT